MTSKDLLKTIGNTPIKELDDNIFVKLECFNPAGSIKDRTALYMIMGAEKKGKLKKGGTIIEETSGNTGIGIAYICQKLGYKSIIVMPDNMSKERIDIISSYGAEVVLTDAKLGMQGAVDKANELHQSIENSILAGQFVNNDNKKAHFETTAPEIEDYFEGDIDIIVAGIGTGGTISGIGEYFKQFDYDTLIVGVEPDSSPLLNGGEAGEHKIQGIGANFIPEVLNQDVLDIVVDITDDEAFEGVRELYKKYGLKLGISSGASYVASKQLAKIYRGARIVFIAPDGEDRYRSMNLYND